MALIMDTGPLYASMDRADPEHEACRLLLIEADGRLVVPGPVVVETEWLTTRRLGALAFDSLLASIEDGGLIVADLDAAAWTRVREVCHVYADLELGLVDASVVAVAEGLGEQRIATLDHRHFRVVRPNHITAFQLLPD